MRLLWVAIGGIALALGLIGVALPLVPTVPFLLVAAYAFARSSPRLHGWLMNHPRFGPPLQEWQRHRAISRRAKTIAVIGMTVGIVIGGLMLPLWLWLAQIVATVASAAFVVTRAEPPAGDSAA